MRYDTPADLRTFDNLYAFLRAVRAHVLETGREVLAWDEPGRAHGYIDGGQGGVAFLVPATDGFQALLDQVVPGVSPGERARVKAAYTGQGFPGLAVRIAYVNDVLKDLSLKAICATLSRVRGQPPRQYGAERKHLLDYEIRFGVHQQDRGEGLRLLLRCVRQGVVVGEADRELPPLRSEHELLVFVRDTLAAYLVVQAQNMLQLDELPYFQSAEGVMEDLGAPFLALVDSLRDQRFKESPKTLAEMKREAEARARRDDEIDGGRFSGGW